MEAATQTPEKTESQAAPPARLRDRYQNEVLPALIEKFGYSTPMSAPRLVKVTVNMGIGEATHKLGANPLYQSLMGQKFDLEADMASISGRMRLLQQQAGQVMSKLQGLAGLEAEYNTLSTERSALRDSIKTFTQRIQENEAAQEMKAGDDTVRVVEKASMPNRPKSLKRIILILSFLFAGFTALCAGLLRVYTRKGFANAQMAAKALDLPVLAQAKTKVA